MIEDFPTGAIKGVVLTAISHQGLSVQVNGRPGRLAILDEAGHVVASGDDVAIEAESIAVNNYRNFLKAEGHLRIFSNALETISSNDASSVPLARPADR